MWPDEKDPDYRDKMLHALQAQGLLPEFTPATAIDAEDDDDEPDSVPPHMQHLCDEDKELHRNDCTDGTLYGDSNDIVGVPGGPYPYAECPVCAQDPFQQLRAALEARVDQIEAEIATQTLSVRLQGMVDALDWAVEQCEAVMQQIHDRWHQDQARWNPSHVFGADPATTPASGTGQNATLHLRKDGQWIPVGNVVGSVMSNAANSGGMNYNADAAQAVNALMQQREIERQEQLRQAELRLWMAQRPDEDRNEWKARTFAVLYGHAPPNTPRPINYNTIIQEYLDLYRNASPAPTEPVVWSKSLSADILRQLEGDMHQQVRQYSAEYAAARPVNPVIDPHTLDLGIKRQIEGARNQFTFFDELGAWADPSKPDKPLSTRQKRRQARKKGK